MPRRPQPPRLWPALAMLAACLAIFAGCMAWANHEANECRERGGVVDRYGRVGEFVHCEEPSR